MFTVKVVDVSEAMARRIWTSGGFSKWHLFFKILIL